LTGERMSDLATYYRNLATWEGKPVVELVAPWSQTDVQDIGNDFRTAFGLADLRGHPLTVGLGVTNQSIGNKVADFFVTNLNRHLGQFRIEDCSGAGYPDKRLVRLSDRGVFAFELKATSDFDPNDSNRIVLTSSSEKLRRYFRPPVFHILATACYGQKGTQIEIGRLRLDFLEPTTPVNVRLEASVSQRILARATHPNISI